mmetsp:Transcript_12501/g.15682  ORF Transcript_12501/g.15682 Transcript_12501/m.15682 type:complete len:272 (-) Transcript_12501:53-868(-)
MLEEPEAIQWPSNSDNTTCQLLRGPDANLTRQSHAMPDGTFRTRVTLPSRTCTSPVPENSHDVDDDGIGNYEEIILAIPTVTTTLTSQNDGFQNIDGELLISTRRILFAPRTTMPSRTYDRNDLSIPSILICLHALQSSDPNPNVYLQLTTLEDGGSSAAATPIEIQFTPQSNEESSQYELLQSLFNALSETAELNPPPPEEGDECYYPCGGSGDEDDGFFFRDDTDGVVTEEERGEMLNRLDDLLVVPSHLEVVEGQFEDAEDDDDDPLL